MNEIDDYLYDEIKGKTGYGADHRGDGRDHRPHDAVGPTPDAGVKTMRQRISTARETIRYEVRYLSTRRTLGIEVHPDGRWWFARRQIATRHYRGQSRQACRLDQQQLANFQRYSPRTPADGNMSAEKPISI